MDYSTKRTLFEHGCIAFSNGQPINFKSKLKLLGTQLRQNLDLGSLVENRRKRGMHRLWQLHRLQANGVGRVHLVDA